MNLGDGLKLETQILDGKTKLILAPYATERRGNKQAGDKVRTQRTTLKIKQQNQILKSVQSNNVKAEQSVPKSRSGTRDVPPSKPPVNVLKELENKHHSSVIQQNVQPAKQDPGKTKPVPKKIAPSTSVKQRPQKLQQKATISAEQLRESLVCLTQEQFQQILSTINQGNKTSSQDGTDDAGAVNKEAEEENITGLLKAENEGPSALTGPDLQTTEQNTNVKDANRQGDLFSTLGERESDKSLQEAKKAQWRRELDEQVALKKQMKESTQDWPYSKRHETCSTEPTDSRMVHLLHTAKDTHPNDYGTPSPDDPVLRTSTGTETTNSSPMVLSGANERASSFSSLDLPAAIRSSFVLGEAAPMDHPFSAIKRQQQQKWLDELNEQRNEVLLRKQQEKRKLLETEEHDRWAMHFDSFKKKNDPQKQAPHHDAQIPLSANHFQSQELAGPPLEAQFPSPTPKNLPSDGAEMQKPADGQKAGFLRTMTALLDPVQIEERDRKRIKQLEHQKAIAAQVEEKRRRKQQEDEQRQRDEQEEERRLAKERDQMRKQFEEDSFRQKQKEEVLNLQTKELYESMLRAQEEAHRIKQEQRMRDLAQKGHDISKLKQNQTGDALQMDSSRAGSRITDVASENQQIETSDAVKQMSATVNSPRKDTAVQTDDFGGGIHLESEIPARGTAWRQAQNPSPDIPVEFKGQSRADLHIKKLKSLREKSSSRKENKNTINDVYDEFARTDRQDKEPGRKPDWNKNYPRKKFVPASERYPKGLQKQREENKIRRQNELLHLVEKNCVNNLQSKRANSPEKSLSPHEDKKGKQTAKKEEQLHKVDSTVKRSDSPPVPAVKNRLHQAQKKQTTPSTHSASNGNSVQDKISPESSEQESERPPSSRFIPYVRTKEIYYLDPDAPMSRPSTHDPQYRRNGDDPITRQIFSSDHARDPLLNPDVVKNKDRQQAILRGLSELRKGLLQKQKELESGLMPDL
ncbi:coiled-coil domain-containing protein 66 [Rhinophrynus dorsalis]